MSNFIEVLIALLILSIGLLAGAQAQLLALQHSQQAYKITLTAIQESNS